MSEFNITVPGGESKRLKTGGKYCPADIVVTAEGRMPVEEKDVNFYDYDGTLLYSYTLEEAQALTELPPAPTPKKDFLLFQEWNWTLDEIKGAGEGVDVGALYTTVDGKSRFVVAFDEDDELSLTFNFRGNGTIEWGDGTSENFTGTSMYTIRAAEHTYPSAGRYTIAFSGTLGTGFYCLGYPDQSLAVIGDAGFKCNGRLIEVYGSAEHRVPQHVKVFYWCRGLKVCSSASFYEGDAVGSTAFYRCSNLRYFACGRRPKLGGGSFNECVYLGVVSVAPTVTNYDVNYTFRMTSALRRCRINDGTTSLPNYMFYQARNIAELRVPASVTTINAMCFYETLSLEKLVFEGKTPPTVANANALQSVATFCRVEVPAASLEAYKNATNYGTIAAQMIGV